MCNIKYHQCMAVLNIGSIFSYLILSTKSLIIIKQCKYSNTVNVPGSASMTLSRDNIQTDAYIFKVFYRLSLTPYFSSTLLVNNDLYHDPVPRCALHTV